MDRNPGRVTHVEDGHESMDNADAIQLTNLPVLHSCPWNVTRNRSFDERRYGCIWRVVVAPSCSRWEIRPAREQGPLFSMIDLGGRKCWIRRYVFVIMFVSTSRAARKLQR